MLHKRSRARRYVAEYRAEWKRLTSQAAGARKELERPKGELERKVARLVQKIEDGEAEGAAGRIVMAQLNFSAEELEKVQSDLAEAAREHTPVELHPNLGERLARQVRDLRRALEGEAAHAAQAREALRSLIDRVAVSAEPGAAADGRGAGPVAVVLEGRMAALLRLGSGRPDDYRFELGAGAGFEPATFRL